MVEKAIEDRFNSWPAIEKNLPLKRGIRTAIGYKLVKVGGGPKEARELLAAHCSSPEYLQNLAKGGPRYTLKGNPSAHQIVTTEERDQARQKLGLKVRPTLSLKRKQQEEIRDDV